jgi:transcriptional regulator with XRE-family HTH domain
VAEDIVTIGERIKQRRQRMGLSLRALAGRADVSAAFLSQVERGKSNISIETLRRISDALDASILALIPENAHNGEDHHPNEEGTITVVRRRSRPRLPMPDTEAIYELLTPDLNRKFQVVRGRMGPGAGRIALTLKQPTEQCIYLLQGELQIGFESEAYTLYPGDCVFFEGSLIKEMNNTSEDQDAIWVSIITPPVF